ncbi:MAG: hypothetical protein K2X98_06375, partial [Alphaproteobacteria bacterium]|nr:hypothetical protein [Alphaproteobacteria bacterium]
MMNRLEVMCAHKKERPTLISDPDTLLFIQMKDSYIDSLLSAFQTIHRVLPKGTITKVVLTSNSLNQRGKALKKIKAEIS